MFNYVEYWKQRIASGGYFNTSKTAISEIERQFLTPYLKQGQTVIDYGCGDGKLIPLFQRVQPEKVYFADVADFSARLQAAYERHAATFKYEYRVLPAIMDTAPDVICCVNVLQHVPPEQIEQVLQVFFLAPTVLITAWQGDPEAVLASHCFWHDYESILQKIGRKYEIWKKLNYSLYLQLC